MGETGFPPCSDSPGWTRTNNPPVNSRMLCQLSYRGTVLSARHCSHDRRGEEARATAARASRLRALARDCALELLLGHARAAFDVQPLRGVVELLLGSAAARGRAAAGRGAAGTRAAARLRPTGALRAGRARARPGSRRART